MHLCVCVCARAFTEHLASIWAHTQNIQVCDVSCQLWNWEMVRHFLTVQSPDSLHLPKCRCELQAEHSTGKTPEPCRS